MVTLALLLVAGAGYLAYQAINEGAVDAPRAEASGESYVEIGGHSIRYRDEGPTGAPVLLMLHGFTFSLDSFDTLAERLKADYRVLRYDLRGHGLTGPDPQKRYAPEERAALIGDFLDAVGVEKATIIGNSLGGLAAWRFAAEAPSRVEGLVLISPGAYPMNGVGEEPAPVPPMLAAYLRTVPQVGLDASLSRIYADGQSLTEERRTQIRAMMTQPGNGDAFVDALRVFTLPDPEPQLSSIGVPTLIVWGEEDLVIDPGHGAQMVSVMPNASLLMLPDVGHVAQEEAPEQLAEAIRAFLANGEGASMPGAGR
jgi:pimeloyl-ACP methyl ester carboxylesterase